MGENCRTDEILKSKGIKATKPRKKILEEILANNQPVSAQELKARLIRNADLATVYRFLHELVSAGVIRAVFTRDERQYYEHLCGDRPAHAHFYCVDCRKLICLDAVQNTVEFFQKELVSGFEINAFRVELEGVCPDCKFRKN